MSSSVSVLFHITSGKSCINFGVIIVNTRLFSVSRSVIVALER